ncbi:M3 family oligoendopeptidase [Cohnella endophytica]|uniref:M3 family oligoendopeptidase n=1 Tax=Cohnella endophytica TaxID=2419778 RepID=A0A494Y868_9BACL|nr:M3 family oligoendopeptidase [Cohnella endophytica]RKP56112.1 M3 family oligoendopeptidase [Cohnella endophytica]
MSNALRWNLDSLFPGGSASPQYAAFVGETEVLVTSLLKELQDSSGSEAGLDRLTEWTDKLQTAVSRLREADAFVSCITSQDMKDKRAVAWTERIQTLSSKLKQAMDLYDANLASVPDSEWQEWSGRAAAEIRFPLDERRDSAKDKLPPALEAVASELAVNGYHGWGEHYNTIVGRISIPWNDDNGQEEKLLSVGQAANKLDDPNPSVRDAMAVKWEEAWSGQADLTADTLNRLAGFRLKLYGMRGWDDPIREPLRINRMSRETLDAMWKAVEGGIEPLKRYLKLKAQRFGKEKLAWHDVDAPIATSQAKIPFEEASHLITDAFERFSPNMAKLARKAFEERWIEAADRPGKRPGGFCTSFPISRQGRIFMTYSGTPGNVSTLAHELGHAYHGELVEELPPFAQDYAMNVAETASTFAEALVSDALLGRAESKEDKLALLDDRLQRAVAFCMNIRARFLFETRFYDRRASGMLEADELSELMVAAQKEAFGDALGSWHPHFWAAKLHFYITDVPFYNFPYTFGYLFSTGLVAVAEREGVSFSERYDSLLRDTGIMTVEQLASRHLGIALDEPRFWEDAVARAVADVETFARLIEE